MKLFENLPSTKTPINAENLNQIQDNLVVVSATEPTGDNREKVWLQKGKNLFNKNNCLTYAWVGDNGNNINSNDNNVLSALIPCKPNTKYTLSGFVSNAYIIVIGFDSSRKYTWTIANQLETRNVKTITTGANDNFIKVGFGYAVPNLSTLMVNQGDVALPYEEYITPKTYVKNDNGIYEEFSENTDTGWIDISFCLNTSIFSVREGQTPLVRKIGNVVYLRGEVYISTKPNEQTNIMFSNLPAQFVPKYQVTGAGVTYATFRPYSIWTEDDTIRCNIDNTDVQVHISGFDLCNLAPYIVD